MTIQPIFKPAQLFNTPLNSNDVATITVAFAALESNKNSLNKDLLDHLMVSLFKKIYPLDILGKELEPQLKTLNKLFNTSEEKINR
jgi:hypothetical protein